MNSWPQRANQVRKLRKHIKWVEEVREFATALDDEDLRAGAHVLKQSLQRKVAELQAQTTQGCVTLTPGSGSC